jgi:hypothetical protein
MHFAPAPTTQRRRRPGVPQAQSLGVAVAQTSKNLDELPQSYSQGPEIRVPTAGTWIGLGAGLLVVMAGFVWTIL